MDFLEFHLESHFKKKLNYVPRRMDKESISEIRDPPLDEKITVYNIIISIINNT